MPTSSTSSGTSSVVVVSGPARPKKKERARRSLFVWSSRDGTRTFCTPFARDASWEHRDAQGVRIQESGVPGADRGMYAAKTFRPGDKICSYTGELVSTVELNSRYGDFTAPYGLQIDGHFDGQYHIDAAGVRGLGSMANGAIGRDLAPNAMFFTNAGRASVKATKHIPAGREILVNYGRDYRLDGVHREVQWGRDAPPTPAEIRTILGTPTPPPCWTTSHSACPAPLERDRVPRSLRGLLPEI